jgi:hypothetical protein
MLLELSPDMNGSRYLLCQTFGKDADYVAMHGEEQENELASMLPTVGRVKCAFQRHLGMSLHLPGLG